MPSVSTYGVHVTIGASHVLNTSFIENSPEAGTYYEFIEMDSRRIITPPEYWDASKPWPDQTNAEWTSASPNSSKSTIRKAMMTGNSLCLVSSFNLSLSLLYYYN